MAPSFTFKASIHIPLASASVDTCPSLTLLLPLINKDPCDTGPLDRLESSPHHKICDKITYSKSLLPPKVVYSQVPGIRMWVLVGSIIRVQLISHSHRLLPLLCLEDPEMFSCFLPSAQHVKHTKKFSRVFTGQ